MTFKEGFEQGVLKLPFSMKMYHDTFLSLESFDEFKKLYKDILEFRTNTIKRGWAVKYGLAYKDEEYDLLENLSEEELINWKDPRKNIKFTLDNLPLD